MKVRVKERGKREGTIRKVSEREEVKCGGEVRGYDCGVGVRGSPGARVRATPGRWVTSRA